MARFILNIGDSLKSHDEVAGEDLNVGDLVYLAPNSKWYKASALYKGTSTTELKLVAKKTEANKPTDLIYYGYFSFKDQVLEPNKKYYVSIENGKITEDVYLNSTNLVRYVGTAYDKTTLLFNPDQTYVDGHGTEINEVPIGGGGGGDMMSSMYDPTEVEGDAFDFDNFYNVPDFEEVDNRRENLNNPDHLTYPTTKAVLDAISSSGGGDMLKSEYDPTDTEGDVFDFTNMHSVPPFLEDAPVDGKVYGRKDADWEEVVNTSSGVQSVTGDGVSGTPEDVVMTFPTPAEIGAQEQFTTDESLYLDPVTKVLRANLTTTIDTFDYLSGVQEFTLTETPVRMLYIWVQGVGLVKKNVQYEVDVVNKKLTILDELEVDEVITACYHNVINESITPFVTEAQVDAKLNGSNSILTITWAELVTLMGKKTGDKFNITDSKAGYPSPMGIVVLLSETTFIWVDEDGFEITVNIE